MSEEKEFDKILIGIKNIGNTCYINSLTQCLIHTEPFRKLILDKNNLIKMNYNILNNTKNLINGEIINITYICNRLKKKLSYYLIILFENYINNQIISSRKYVERICDNEIFEFGVQNDCQELFTYIINKLKEELKDEVNIDLNNNILNIYNTLDINNDIKTKLIDLEKMINRDFSIVTTPFLSISDTVVKCECNYESHIFDIPIQLQLNLIGDDKIINMKDCLNDYYNEIKCEEYKCSNCNNITELKKQEYIWLAPQILVIHLKRFITSFENGIYSQKKIHTIVKYEEILDMSKYMIDKNREYKYELYGMCNHFGSLNGGHYYSHIKKNNIWYCFNDDKIFKLDKNDHLDNKHAYLLFYELKKNE